MPRKPVNFNKWNFAPKQNLDSRIPRKRMSAIGCHLRSCVPARDSLAACHTLLDHWSVCAEIDPSQGKSGQANSMALPESRQPAVPRSQSMKVW